MKAIYTYIILASIYLASCAPKIDFGGDVEYNQSDSTYNMMFYSQVDDDILYFDTMKVRKLTLFMTDNNNNEINQTVIIPYDNEIDLSNPLLALPYFEGDPVLYYSLISYSKKTKRPILPMSYRGSGLNESLEPQDITTDVNDLLNYIYAYMDVFEVENLKLDVFANSYGGIVYSLTDFGEKVSIDQVVFESVPVNYKNTLKDMEGAQEIAEEKNLTEILQNEYEDGLIEKDNNGIMYLYGTNDDGIRLGDVQKLANRIGMEVKVIDNAYHLMRIRYPLDAHTYNSINKEFMNFLDR